MGGRIIAVINGKKYQVIFGNKFTTFKEVGSIKIRSFKNDISVKDVKRMLK